MIDTQDIVWAVVQHLQDEGWLSPDWNYLDEEDLYDVINPLIEQITDEFLFGGPVP